MIKIIQVMVTNGRQFSIEVSGTKQFSKLKRKATWRKGGFFILCETCTIKRSEIVSVEFVEVEGEK